MEGRTWQTGRALPRALRAGRHCLVCFGHTLPGHGRIPLPRLMWILLSRQLPDRAQADHTSGLVEESDKAQVCVPDMEVICCWAPQPQARIPSL